MDKYIFILFFSFSYSEYCAPETDWCFDISTLQSFYMFFDVDIEGESIESGSVSGSGSEVWLCPNSDCDIIAAFYNGICIGWTYPFFNGVYTLPISINDGTLNGYPSIGDTPEFKLYDYSSDEIYYTATDGSIPEIQVNGFFQIDLLYSISEIEYSIQLYDGNNLISFYALPEDTSIEGIFSQLGTNINSVISEGTSASQLPNIGWVGSLINIGIEPTQGYWVNLNETEILTVSGQPYEDQIYNLYLGYNLISFPYSNSIHITDAIPDEVEDYFKNFIGEGISGSNLYGNDNIDGNDLWVGSLDSLKGGKGYWVKIVKDGMTFDDTLTFSFENPN